MSWRKLSKEVSTLSPALYSLYSPLIRSGVTIVQYRDKTGDTAVQIETARKLHQITKTHNVPLVINDRVDVAIAAGVEGVHLGQDDMGMLSYPENEAIGTKP